MRRTYKARGFVLHSRGSWKDKNGNLSRLKSVAASFVVLIHSACFLSFLNLSHACEPIEIQKGGFVLQKSDTGSKKTFSLTSVEGFDEETVYPRASEKFQVNNLEERTEVDPNPSNTSMSTSELFPKTLTKLPNAGVPKLPAHDFLISPKYKDISQENNEKLLLNDSISPQGQHFKDTVFMKEVLDLCLEAKVKDWVLKNGTPIKEPETKNMSNSDHPGDSRISSLADPELLEDIASTVFQPISTELNKSSLLSDVLTPILSVSGVFVLILLSAGTILLFTKKEKPTSIEEYDTCGHDTTFHVYTIKKE